MRRKYIIFTILIFTVLLALGWKTRAQGSQTLQQPNETTQITPLPIVQEMIDQVSQERILTDLRRFTGVENLCINQDCRPIAGRFTESEDLQRVQSYVYWNLVNLNYSVEYLHWTNGTLSDENILAHKQGLLYPNEEIYFIAHLDGYPANNSAADDNASGAVALLELARILAIQHLSRSVTIFFSTGEEQGAQGAQKFVDDYADRLGNIKYLVNVEMLGYDSNDDGVMELFNGSQPPDFVQMLLEIINAYPIALSPEIYSDCG